MYRLIALALCGFLALPVLGCGSPGGRGAEEVADPAILAFADRIQSFYAAIQDVPLDVELTYDNSSLRSFFANDTDFNSYYASLASQLRRAQFRNATLDRVSIVEFRFDKQGIAKVDVKLFGRHERRLRLGVLELARQDVWQLRDGSWMVTPEKL